MEFYKTFGEIEKAKIEVQRFALEADINKDSVADAVEIADKKIEADKEMQDKQIEADRQLKEMDIEGKLKVEKAKPRPTKSN